MVSLKDIATKLGVGVSTVSAVLNKKDYCYVSDTKKNLILDTAKNMGYVANQMSRGMQGLPTKTIGIIGSLFSVPIMSELVDFMNKEITKAGYSIMLGDSYSQTRDEETIINEFLARGVDGILISSTCNKVQLEKLLKKRIPYISFNKEFDGLTVTMDREAGAFMAVEHFIKKHTRKRIAFVAKGLNSNVGKLLGYRRALEMYGLEFDNKFCIETNSFQGFSDVAKLIDDLNCDAVFASNDFIAGMSIKYMKQLGKRVPEDIAIIGFDGLKDVCRLTTPTLTSIKDPVEKVAKESVKLLLKRIQGKKIKEVQHMIAPEWLTGESCGCINQNSKN
ncbi:MAG: LacI family DNA-binding transcriptional regulator [Verrucomicrobiota bacterium]|nr:LacI family DNA-binding transcriptional regulator [Verrucomicrobiota bacterium]